MSCALCNYGKSEYGGQVRCQCVESDYFDKLMDSEDTCGCYRKKKVMQKKGSRPEEIIEHIKLDLSQYDKPKEPVKTEKKEKNYKVKAGNKINTIYVIVCDGHTANFGEWTNGLKHYFYHEEEKAKAFCSRASTPFVKYKYIECKINNEL